MRPKIIKTRYFLLILLATSLFITFRPDSTVAHSGRTNSSGCHNDNISGGYHCHNGGYEDRYNPKIILYWWGAQTFNSQTEADEAKKKSVVNIFRELIGREPTQQEVKGYFLNKIAIDDYSLRSLIIDSDAYKELETKKQQEEDKKKQELLAKQKEEQRSNIISWTVALIIVGLIAYGFFAWVGSRREKP